MKTFAILSALAALAFALPAESNQGAPIKEYYQCGGTNYKGNTACEQGLECKVQNPYFSQCVKSDGSAPNPSSPKPSGTTPPNNPPSTSPQVGTPSPPPSSGGEKMYTLETLIAFIEKEAGSDTAGKIRRMVEALQ